MYGKLVHRPPFGHHYHAPRPPFGEPREVGERYLGHPELTDYWIKPYLLEALKHYPRLDDDCVVEGLWKFANTICLQNKHTSIRTPPTYDDPVTTHKIAFLDKDDIELGCIKFWRKVDSTFGIDMILNGRGISITGNNDDPTLCLVDTPIGDNKKQIVNIEYLEFSLSALQGLVDGLTDRIGALEDYKGQADSLIRDPNGNFRTVHTAIHNDSDDQNIPTCYAVYQFGKGISDALNTRIGNLPSVTDSVQDGNMHPVTSNAVADELSNIRGTLSALSSSISSIANDVASLQSAINNSGGGSSGGSGGGSNDSYIFAYPSGSPDGFDLTLASINTWDVVTGDHIASAVEVSIPGSENHPEIVTYTIDQNSSLDSTEFTYAAYYGSPEVVYNPTTLSSSDSYRCITAPVVTRGTGAGGAGDTRPWIRVKAGVFQRIGGSGSGGGGSTTTWATVSHSWSQFYSGNASGGSYVSLRQSNTSLLGDISGAGTNYNSPKFKVGVAANGEYIPAGCVAIGETFTCTNTDTNISKSYIPLRLVVTYDGTRSSGGGNEPGGTYWQNVSARVWYKEADYTLTSQDISDINAAADAFAATRSCGYDSGALS